MLAADERADYAHLQPAQLEQGRQAGVDALRVGGDVTRLEVDRGDRPVSRLSDE